MLSNRQKCAFLQMRLFRQGKQQVGENLENYFLLRIFKSPYDGPIFPQRAMRQAERNFFIETQAEYLLKLELLAQGREFEPDTPPERLIFRDCVDLSDEDLEVEFVELVETEGFADFVHGRKRDLKQVFLRRKVSDWLDRAEPLATDAPTHERRKRKQTEDEFENRLANETDPTKISDRQKIQRIGEEFLEAI